MIQKETAPNKLARPSRTKTFFLVLVLLGSYTISLHFANQQRMRRYAAQAGYTEHDWGYSLRFRDSPLGVVEKGVYDKDDKGGFYTVDLETENYSVHYYVFGEGLDGDLDMASFSVGHDPVYATYREIPYSEYASPEELKDYDGRTEHIINITLYDYANQHSSVGYQDIDWDGEIDYIIRKNNGKWESWVLNGATFELEGVY